MLVAIQRKLTHTVCPSCEKSKVLQAVLACSRDDKTCATNCQCRNCGISFIVNIPENITEVEIDRITLSIVCSTTSSSCELRAVNVKNAG